MFFFSPTVPVWSTHRGLGKQIFHWEKIESFLQPSWRDLWRNWTHCKKHHGHTQRLWRQTWRKLVKQHVSNNLSLVHTLHFCPVEFNPSKCGRNTTVDSYVALVSNLIKNVNCRVCRSAENVLNVALRLWPSENEATCRWMIAFRPRGLLTNAHRKYQ